MAKVQLLIKTYKSGSRIGSVPLWDLRRLARYKKRRWNLKVLDGNVWLILEGF
jgi:hypothetical protein